MMKFHRSRIIQSKTKILLIVVHQFYAVFHEKSEYVICFKLRQRNYLLKAFLLYSTAFANFKKSKNRMFRFQKMYLKETLKFLKIRIQIINDESSASPESFIEFGGGLRIVW